MLLLDHSNPSFPEHTNACVHPHTSRSASPIALAVSAAMTSCKSAGMIATATSTSVPTRGCLLNRHSSDFNDSRHLRLHSSPRRRAAIACMMPMMPSDAVPVARAMGCTSAIPKTLTRLQSGGECDGVDFLRMGRSACVHVCARDGCHTSHTIFQREKSLAESLTHPTPR